MNMMYAGSKLALVTKVSVGFDDVVVREAII